MTVDNRQGVGQGSDPGYEVLYSVTLPDEEEEKHRATLLICSDFKVRLCAPSPWGEAVELYTWRVDENSGRIQGKVKATDRWMDLLPKIQEAHAVYINRLIMEE